MFSLLAKSIFENVLNPLLSYPLKNKPNKLDRNKTLFSFIPQCYIPNPQY